MLVLSLFPGIGLLDMAFEQERFCVVRGPDVLWGGDIRRFHPLEGKFDGVIGGPPCQIFSQLRYMNPAAGAKTGNLIPEFERCVREANPTWFIMENVPAAPVPEVPGFITKSGILNNRFLGEDQNRTRRINFGTKQGIPLPIQVEVFESPFYGQTVTSSARAVSVKFGGSGKVKRTYTQDGKRHGPSFGKRMGLSAMLVAQGFPADMLDDCPFTNEGKRKMIGNGVPLPMGRAIARAVKEACNAMPTVQR